MIEVDNDKEVARLLLKQKALGLNDFYIVKDKESTDKYVMFINRRCKSQSLDIPSFISTVTCTSQTTDEINTTLKEVNINCEIIEDFTFSNFKCIESMNIGPNVKYIKGSLFLGASKLKELDLSKSKIQIITNQIAPYSGVERIILPETLTKIRYAFLSMPKLKEIDMSKCTKMKELKLNALNLTGSGTNNTIKIKLNPNLAYIPKGSIIKSCGTKLILEFDINIHDWHPVKTNGIYNDNKVVFNDISLTGKEIKNRFSVLSDKD